MARLARAVLADTGTYVTFNDDGTTAVVDGAWCTVEELEAVVTPLKLPVELRSDVLMNLAREGE